MARAMLRIAGFCGADGSDECVLDVVQQQLKVGSAYLTD